MPIVDGLTSTKMIRSHEKSHSTNELSPRAQLNSRIPIFAVSATLIESQRQSYIDTGFDGWILKPVDFKRLSTLFQGIVDQAVREECVYRPGEWEKGGWFESHRQGPVQALTTPEPNAAVSSMPALTSSAGEIEHATQGSFDDRISREQKRLDSLQSDAVTDPSVPSTE